MITHERVAENLFAFQSDNYVQVNAGVVIGPNWGVLIDTLAFPEETLQIKQFVEQELRIPVRYIINTHYHADHSWGNCFFPGAMVISSTLCRKLLAEQGRLSLQQTRKQNPGYFRNVKIVLPHLTFSKGNLGIRVGKKTLTLLPLPGHSDDGIGVLVEEDRVLFSGDVFMPLPVIADGDWEKTVNSLNLIASMGLENIVQGHGDIVLRGEIDGAVNSNLEYLTRIRETVVKSSGYKYPLDYLDDRHVDAFKKSHVLLGGVAGELHRRNLVALFKQIYGSLPAASDEFSDGEFEIYEEEEEEVKIISRRGDDDDDDFDDFDEEPDVFLDDEEDFMD